METTPPATALMPTVGRIVHFHASAESPPEAAIVIAVRSGMAISVSRCNSAGTWSTSMALEHESTAAGAAFWRWPPRA